MQPKPPHEWTARIAIDDRVLTGKPVIKGTRLAVEFIIELLARGWSENEILENYPGIVIEDIRLVLLMQNRRTSFPFGTQCTVRAHCVS